MRQITPFIRSLALLLLCGCSESDSLIIDETKGIEYSTGDIYIDKYGNQGIVCHVSPKKIMIVSSDEAYLSWGPLDVKVTPYDSLKAYYDHSDDFEYYNLAVLSCALTLGIDQFPAMKWCNDKNNGEKNPSGASWHLPNRVELTALRNFDYYCPNMGFDPQNKYYWTCIEDIRGCSSYGLSTDNFVPQDRAMPLNLTGETLSNKDLWTKRNKYYVRAVKYIYYETYH